MRISVSRPMRHVVFAGGRKLAHHVAAVAAAAKARRVPMVPALAKSLNLYLRHAFSLKEIVGYGLFVPEVAAKYPVLISKHRSLGCLERWNPQERHPLTEDKAEFHLRCVSARIRTATTYGWTSRGKFFMPDGRQVSCLAAWREHLGVCLPANFIVKDRAGAYGSGFQVVRRDGGDRFVVGQGGPLGVDALIEALMPAEKNTDLIIQQRLYDAPSLRRLSGKRSLQTLRINTLLEDDGRVSILFYMLKIIAGDVVVDNFSMGATGNLIGFGDRGQGVLRGAVTLHASGCGMAAIHRHPVTGMSLDGFVIPSWREAIELVSAAQRNFKELRTLGWDVALTDDGPVIIEANARWDPPLYAPFLLGDGDWQRLFGASAKPQ